MMSRAEIKAEAKRIRNAAVPSAIAVTLLYTLIMAALNALPTYDTYMTWAGFRSGSGTNLMIIILNLISAMLSYGFSVNYCLGLVRGEPVSYGNLFDGFRSFSRIFVLELLIYIFTFLWALLFIIPGIIANYRYALAPYLLRDNPDMTPMQAIARSKELMQGHKMELFVLQLSFIGWLILSALTFGIVSLWVTPHMGISQALFYDQLAYPQQPTGPQSPLDDGGYTMANFADGDENYREVDDEQ